MKSSKGIIIELTSLLDVILIMLFWVLMQFSNQNEAIEKQAQAEIDSANSQAYEIKIQLEEEKIQTQQLSQALDAFDNGSIYTLNLSFEGTSDILVISCAGEEIGRFDFSQDTDVGETIAQSIENLAKEQGETMLTAVVYDGSTVLYRDITAIKNSMDNLQEQYQNIYCTYINTSIK